MTTPKACKYDWNQALCHEGRSALTSSRASTATLPLLRNASHVSNNSRVAGHPSCGNQAIKDKSAILDRVKPSTIPPAYDTPAHESKVLFPSPDQTRKSPSATLYSRRCQTHVDVQYNECHIHDTLRPNSNGNFTTQPNISINEGHTCRDPTVKSKTTAGTEGNLNCNNIY
jgi:hypothetical protein